MSPSTLAAFGFLCVSLSAQSFSYPDFSSAAQLNLLGNSVQAGNAIRLTANASNQSGWMWRTTPMPILNGFDTTFTFRVAPSPVGIKAEGLAFVVHADPDGASAMGGTVWGIGYGTGANNTSGIRNSIVIEFDTYQDAFLGDTSNNELTIHTRGVLANDEAEQWSIGRVTPTQNFADNQVHTVRVVYVPGTLTVYYDNLTTPALTRPFDLETGGLLANGQSIGGLGATDGVGVAGFCATTGASTLTEQVEILSWDWVSTPLADLCYEGTLSADTLTVDGDAGGYFRRVEVATHQPFDVEIANPPAFGPAAPYILFGSVAPQPGALGTSLGFGDACLSMLPMGPSEFVLIDTFGVGPGLLSGSPTPFAFSVPAGVLASPVELTLQAVTLDTSSPLTLGLTNAVELAVVAVGPPEIWSMGPLSAAPGSTITIAGSGFIPGLTLSVGGSLQTPLAASPASVQFAYPSTLPCDTAVVVANPDGQAVSVMLNPTPVVTSTLLGSGSSAGGAVFIVVGDGFAPGTTVTIGGVPATVISATSSVVTMHTPPGHPGLMPVVLTTPGGCTATTTYTYL